MISICQMVKNSRNETRSSPHSLGRKSKAFSLVAGESHPTQDLIPFLISNRTCPEVQPWLYGYDAIKEVEKAVAENPDLFLQSTSSRSFCQIL